MGSFGCYFFLKFSGFMNCWLFMVFWSFKLRFFFVVYLCLKFRVKRRDLMRSLRLKRRKRKSEGIFLYFVFEVVFLMLGRDREGRWDLGVWKVEKGRE